MMRNIFADDWFDRGVAVGVAQGRDEGIAQGAHDARLETARALCSLGINTIEQISQATGLPLAEIEQLQSTTTQA